MTTHIFYKKKKNIYKKCCYNVNIPCGLKKDEDKRTLPSLTLFTITTVSTKKEHHTIYQQEKTHLVVTHTIGFSESFKNACQKHGIKVNFKGGKTSKRLLVTSKDNNSIIQKGGIFRYKCDRVECDEEDIGKSSRSFGEGFKEHPKTSSPIHDHCNITGHTTTVVNFSIVERKNQNHNYNYKRVNI